MTDEELSEFFRNKAYAYTMGHLRLVSLLFRTPCKFSIGSNVLHIQSASEIENIFDNYRRNLLSKNYSRTTAEVVHIAKADASVQNASLNCLVIYKNFGGPGRIISTEYANYFLDRSADGFLQIVEVEYIDEPNEELFAGLNPPLSSWTEE